MPVGQVGQTPPMRTIQVAPSYTPGHVGIRVVPEKQEKPKPPPMVSSSNSPEMQKGVRVDITA